MDIKAKKISQLSNIDINAQKQRYLDSYFVIAYNNGIDDKANYKVKVADFLESAYSGSIDESVLDDYAKSAYVDNNYMSKASWNNYYTYIMNTIAENMCDCDHSADMSEIWNAIEEIKNLIKHYHSTTTINIKTTNCTISDEIDKDTNKTDNIHRYIIDTNIDGELNLSILPDTGYKFQNEDIQCIGCDFDFDNTNGNLHLFNLSESDVNIVIDAIGKTFSILYDLDENVTVSPSNPNPSTIVMGDSAKTATFNFDSTKYKVSNFSASNAKVTNININTELGLCSISVKANGKGNITIKLMLEPLVYYYFGFADTEDIFELGDYDGNTYPIGLNNVEGLSMLNNKAPFEVGKEYTAISSGENDYRYMIVPQQFFSLDAAKLTDGTQLYNVCKNISGDNDQSIVWVISISRPYLFDINNQPDGAIYDIGNYNDVDYYAILISEENVRENFVIYKANE